MLLIQTCSWAAFAVAAVCLLAALVEQDVSFLIPAVSGLVARAALSGFDRALRLLEEIRDRLGENAETPADPEETVAAPRRAPCAASMRSSAT